MRKLLIKKISTLLIVSIFLSETYATSLSDNDGSAFITKAEFDALKSSFQSQIDTYNQSIDSKIDSAIAGYLAGINFSKKIELSSELNNVKTNSVLGTDYRFGKAWGTHVTKEPTGIWNGYLFSYWGQGPTSDHNWSGAIIAGNVSSINRGDLVLAPTKTSNPNYTDWNAFNPLICFETKRILTNGVTYRTLASFNLYENKYCYEGLQGAYRWIFGTNPDAQAADTWTYNVEYKKYSGMDTTTHTLEWNKCADTKKVELTNDSRSVITDGDTRKDLFSKAYSFRSYYNQTFTKKTDLGWCTDTLNEDIRYVDSDKWTEAWWDDGTDGSYTHIGTDGFCDSAQVSRISYTKTPTNSAVSITAGNFKIPVYIHKSYKMNVDTLVNEPAMKAQFDSSQPVYFYNGLPLCYCTMNGVLTIKLKSKATKATTGVDDTGATYNGTLYLGTGPFGKNTTKSTVLNEDGTAHTAGWGFSNTNKNQTIKIKVNKGDEIWLKYNVASITSGDLIEFETDADSGLVIENNG